MFLVGSCNIKSLVHETIDFIMAYTQALIEYEMYMNLPHCISTRHGCAQDYVLKLINNICGQNQAGMVFADYRDEVAGNQF